MNVDLRRLTTDASVLFALFALAAFFGFTWRRRGIEGIVPVLLLLLLLLFLLVLFELVLVILAAAGPGNDLERGGAAVDRCQRVEDETLEDAGVPLADFANDQPLILDAHVRAVGAQGVAVEDPVVLRRRSTPGQTVESDARSFLHARILRPFDHGHGLRQLEHGRRNQRPATSVGYLAAVGTLVLVAELSQR